MKRKGTSSIPFWSYLPEYTKNKKTIHAILDKALLGGKLILGQNVAQFEHDFAAYCGSQFGVGVGNGIDAIFLSLLALGVGRGDEVVTVPNTAIPTVSPIVATGARPVLVDIDPDTLLVDSAQLERAITKRTKCIIPVDLYGNVCNRDAILDIAKRNHIAILEDCAQSTGALFNGKKVGSFGDIAIFSFYPTKIIGAYGDGGMIVTSKTELEEKARRLRMYGTAGDYYSTMPGYNSRLDEIQAAILAWKLKSIEKYIKSREKIAKHYTDALSGTSLLIPKKLNNVRHVYHLYIVQHEKRDLIMAKMQEKGVTLAVHYRHPLHLMEGFKNLGYTAGDFPQAEYAARTVLSLPIYPELTELEQEKIISRLEQTLQEVD